MVATEKSEPTYSMKGEKDYLYGLLWNTHMPVENHVGVIHSNNIW